ncbi:MAG TPA: alpha/beta fold hydrolase, partial [Mycobacterium sp.]|nr:alpha/beta fold hydrolase [Mycobacterium sp.]
MFVDNGDVRIAVYEHGNPDGPTVVMVHGWPDSHLLWDGVVPLLTDRFRVITYDNRGVGPSSSPRSYREYTMARLADDFAAVVDAVSPTQPVHVIAHDWGSVSVWEYLARPDTRRRVASFTSVSGPSLAHLAAWTFGNLKRPYRLKRLVQTLIQMWSFSAMAVFSIPFVTPAIVRAVVTPPRAQRVLSLADGIPANQIHHSDDIAREASNTLKIYRANYFRLFSGRVRRDHYVDVPVQLIVNTKDPFVRTYSFDDESRWVARLWRRDIKAGHWSPFSHPGVLATSVAELCDVV